MNEIRHSPVSRKACVFFASFCLVLASATSAWAFGSRNEARQLLREGYNGSAITIYSRIAGSSSDASLVAEYALALALAGYADSSLAQLDRAFILDAHDPEALYCASLIFGALGMNNVATELRRAPPDWAAGWTPRFSGMTFDHQIGAFVPEFKRANVLMTQKKFASSANRFARLLAKYPSDRLAWTGYSIALEQIGAYRSAGQATRQVLALSGKASLQEKSLIEAHASALETHPPVQETQAPNLTDSLKGRYLVFLGGNWTHNDLGTVLNLNSRVGKFLTNRFDAGVNLGYIHTTNQLLTGGAGSYNGVTWGANGRYNHPLPFDFPLNATLGASASYAPGPSDNFAIVVSPGISHFLEDGEVDLYLDINMTGPLKNTQALSLGYTHYFGGSK